MQRFLLVSVCGHLCAGAASLACAAAPDARGPYERQVADHVAGLESSSPSVRAGAAESLGFLRAYAAEPALSQHLVDESILVRRQVAMALGWCGSRRSVPALIETLGDKDWVTRQASHVALCNLTGLEFPFDATSSGRERHVARSRWRDWWSSVSEQGTPPQILELLEGDRPWLTRYGLAASSTYKGPVDVLMDGSQGPGYWQTKNVAFPQSLTVDLRRPERIEQVVIHQYGPAFVMTDYELALSLDNKKFEVVRRVKQRSPVKLEIQVPARVGRFVRITSYGSANPIYPTTFLEVEINGPNLAGSRKTDHEIWRFERGLRALGVCGGPRATSTICRFLGDRPPTAEQYRPMVASAIRSLGRLQEEEGFQYLVQLLQNTMWARRAADALGDFGDRRAVLPLIKAYERYAKRVDGTDPPHVPADDKMTFPSEDRMLETPYCIALALSRLQLDEAESMAALRRITPLLLANHPGDHDTFMLYEPEPGHLVTRFLVERAGLREVALKHTYRCLESDRSDVQGAAQWPRFPPYRASSWLPTFGTDPSDLPRLLALLKHKEGWVRLNAAKAIAWLGDRRAIAPLARLLKSVPAEAEFGFSGTFKDEEYADPAPRWREGLIRALGILDADRQTELIVRILEDERSVLEIRRAAADALADLGNEQAMNALHRAARSHSFFSIRNIARDALRKAGASRGSASGADASVYSRPRHRAEAAAAASGQSSEPVAAIVFLKGSNNLPNTIGTVEQADRWRQTYVVTDSGPAYRPARNLFKLCPPRPDGEVSRLTDFEDGYVAEPELSWDALHIVFCRRGQDDPWWHVWRVNIDGTGLRQLTRGPYHHVGPVYLPDGRIMCASSRSGIRDEYHGYPCTALVVMESDGSNLRPVATNIGRDNEPAVLHDGRIVFSRLEVFYSRNKTELTLHAAHIDGTQDVVLYGPERRQFWRDLDHGPRTPADGQEAPLTHRVLRMTQPQPMPDGRSIVVVTQGGLALIGPQRDRETIITPNNKSRAYTTPYPLPDGKILCASTLKTDDRRKVDLGIYLFDPDAGNLQLVYNDPHAADFEARPVMARKAPVVIPQTTTSDAHSGRFLCASVFNTQEREVRSRGKLVRLIEGVPMVARHSTQTNPWEVWKNHGGTLARVLGTIPLAADGSFFVEAPADRLLHFQVLDSDRRVVGNQLTWIYTRPGETKSCVGCHEPPHVTTRTRPAVASYFDPIRLAPHEREFRYRAKAWFKGHLPAEIEERTRTVRAVNLLGR